MSLRGNTTLPPKTFLGLTVQEGLMGQKIQLSHPLKNVLIFRKTPILPNSCGPALSAALKSNVMVLSERQIQEWSPLVQAKRSTLL